VLRARITARGPHSRFETDWGDSVEESELFAATATLLTAEHWPVMTVDVTMTKSAVTAAELARRLLVDFSPLRNQSARISGV
jgi:hypothetical protein